MTDMLSQEEIDALLKGSDEPTDSENTTNNDDNFNNNAEIVNFTEEEKDTIGEVGNISMGTAATTLSTLLGERVTITTPKVKVLTLEELTKQYSIPFVAVDVKYKEGLEGINLLILKREDVGIITDLMMGGDGKVEVDELTDLHLSAIGEAMNQMVGSSSTSLSEMLNKKIDISPPNAFVLDLTTDNLMKYFEDYTNYENAFVKIAFRMVIGDLIDSEIMQLMPIEFAKTIVKNLLYDMADEGDDTYTDPIDEIEDIDMASIEEVYNDIGPGQETMTSPNAHIDKGGEQAASRPTPSPRPAPAEKVNIRPVQFESFDEPSVKGGMPENIALIQDVPLKVTVELGRTVKKISEILEFGPGTIVELDKLVGEPLDILVNGQYVAKGEVVVIDENYGIRVTDIVNPANRLVKT